MMMSPLFHLARIYAGFRLLDVEVAYGDGKVIGGFDEYYSARNHHDLLSFHFQWLDLINELIN